MSTNERIARNHLRRQVRSGFAKRDARRRLISRLNDEGWSYEGSGHFATVLSHPDKPDRVLKVGGANWYDIGAKDGWEAFAQYAMENPSKHLPTIHSFRRSRNGAFYIAEMDRLEELPFNEKLRFPRASYESCASGDRSAKFPKDTPESLKETLARIGERFKDDWRFDIHSDNVMVRPDDGTLVINDPISFQSTE